MQVIQHDGFEWFQEHFLIAEVLSLFLLEELVCKLSERINGVDDNMQILVRAYPCKMLSKCTPDALPLETDTIHVQGGYFYELLKAKLLWAVLVCELVL